MTTIIDSVTIQNILNKADLLHSEREIQLALDDMAVDIHQRLHTKYPVCLGVMLGGLVTAGQLLPRLNMPLEMDYIHATRYRGATQGGELHWIKQPSVALKDRIVLIIDDILDEGLTLKAIVEYCHQAGAREVLTAVLVEKQLPNRPGLQQADFCALQVPNRYVFGYGMDYQGQLRHVAGIYAVNGL
jgi:hypoxanthine phosphoribosyltransferase